VKALEFLKAPPPPAKVRVALVLGPEDYLRARVTDALTEGEEDGVDDFEGPGPGAETPFDAAAFFDALRTPDLFGGARTIRVRRGEKLLSDFGEPLARFLAADEAVHRLVIEASVSAPKDKGPKAAKTKASGLPALVAAVEAAGGVVVACEALYDSPFGGRGPAWQSELTSWVVGEAARRGKKIRPEDAYRLHQLAGTGLRELAGEIEKLATFVGARGSIETGDVERLVGAVRASPAFDFGEAFAAADAKTALRISTELFERGAEDPSGKRVVDETSIAMMMLSAAVSRVRRVGAALAAIEGGASFETAAGQAGVPPFLWEKFRPQLEAWRRRDLGTVLGALVELERGLKGGGGPPRVLVDRAVVAGLVRGVSA
jgi:DNA polymerase III delta subunit